VRILGLGGRCRIPRSDAPRWLEGGSGSWLGSAGSGIESGRLCCRSGFWFSRNILRSGIARDCRVRAGRAGARGLSPRKISLGSESRFGVISSAEMQRRWPAGPQWAVSGISDSFLFGFGFLKFY
jgi:hypothetical protein